MMKMNRLTFLKEVLLVVLFCGISALVNAQTAGTLNVSFGTSAPNGTWGTKHVLAVWLENTANPSVFIKTKAKYGNEDDHLTSWTAKSAKSLVDAVTGSTLSAYNTISVVWNGTNTAGTVVPDGTYKVFVEMGWGSNKTNDHAVASFTFTKGTTAQHVTPAGTTNYTNPVIDWTPLATLVDAKENFDNECVYPNPTTGIININFSRELKGASLKVVNAEGKTLISEPAVNIPVGPKLIDLSQYRNGLYFISIQSAELKTTYKVLMNR
jgi:hypothetical protein